MHFCGYFALPNGPNWKVLGIIPIFGILFCQFGHLSPPRPPRVTVYRVTPYYSVINFVEIPSSLGLNVFLWVLFIIKMVKIGEVICIIPVVGVIFGENLGI